MQKHIDIDKDYQEVIDVLTKQKPIFVEIFRLCQKYAVNGRWWDAWHNEITTVNMITILTEERRTELKDILIPAAILHDIGWSKIDDSKETRWGDDDLRIAHMKIGG